MGQLLCQLVDAKLRGDESVDKANVIPRVFFEVSNQIENSNHARVERS